MQIAYIKSEMVTLDLELKAKKEDLLRTQYLLKQEEQKNRAYT